MGGIIAVLEVGSWRLEVGGKEAKRQRGELRSSERERPLEWTVKKKWRDEPAARSAQVDGDSGSPTSESEDGHPAFWSLLEKSVAETPRDARLHPPGFGSQRPDTRMLLPSHGEL